MESRSTNPEEPLVPIGEPIGLGAQLRGAGLILSVMGAALLFREDSDPGWQRMRDAELAALEKYETTPDGPGKHEAHMEAQDAWRERSKYEAEHIDPTG